MKKKRMGIRVPVLFTLMIVISILLISCSKGKLYEHYGVYEYLLKPSSPSIALSLCEEGLVIIEPGEYRPEIYMVTRDNLVDTPLIYRWDDWP
ncbi:MAG TPA: hypothetical protein VHQ24_05095 [Lachnospiraceae bacterium]|nr:hypothetical protein [Lachnospiraceae bacterium]